MMVEGTHQAFRTVLNGRGVYKKLGVAPSTVSNWRRALNGKDERNMPTLDLMEEMLFRFGAEVAKEKVWRIRKSIK